MNSYNLWITAILILLKIIVSTAAPRQERAEPLTCSRNKAGVASSINNAGFRIAQQIQGEENTFFSPLGLSMALGMAYLGARGKTAREMEEVLGFSGEDIRGLEVHQGIRELYSNLTERKNGQQHTLDLGNGFFSQEGLNVRQTYRDDVRTYYNGFAETVDFANEPVETQGTINEWARESTRGKIETFLEEPLPVETQMLLVNAVYFKGTWKTEFPPKRTYPGYFFRGDVNNHVTVPMMSLAKETFPYYVDKQSGYKYLEMPYKGEEISMLFALPLQFDQSPDLTMTEDLLCRIISAMKPTELDTVSIPKFKLEYKKSMTDVLKRMGLVGAFQPAVADFSGIHEGLVISDVLHQAVIEVNEQGSEAAAITGIEIEFRMLRDVDEFIANRPFLFYIIHKKTGLVLFSGKVVSP